jgi:cell division protein FtsW (lipid II flippase)
MKLTGFPPVRVRTRKPCKTNLCATHPLRIKGDRIIWSVVVVLAFISLLAVYSSTRSLAYKLDKNSTYYLVKQLSVLGIGLLIIYWVHKINYTKFAKLSVLLYVVSLPLLFYTLFFGTALNSGARWISLPVVNLTFQSSDLAKLALFMFLARLLSMKQGSIKDLKKGFLPVLLPVFLTCALIAPANLSTALMLGATCCILLFIGRVQLKHIGMLALAGIVGLALLFVVSKVTGFGRAATWEKRIADFRGAMMRMVLRRKWSSRCSRQKLPLPMEASSVAAQATACNATICRKHSQTLSTAALSKNTGWWAALSSFSCT